jgi:hypothetical protein
MTAEPKPRIGMAAPLAPNTEEVEEENEVK